MSLEKFHKNEECYSVREKACITEKSNSLK